MEKLGYGVMILLMAVGVLTAPFFYARAAKQIRRRHAPRKKDTAAPSEDADDGV